MSRVNAGKAGLWYDSGHGKIWCARAPVHGIEQRLLDITTRLVDENGFSLVISSVDTGKHAAHSRHKTGRAEDVSELHVYGQDPEPVTLANPHAVRAVQWLVDHGFHAGHENGPYDSVLFGPVQTRYNRTRVDHSDHFHASIWKP